MHLSWPVQLSVVCEMMESEDIILLVNLYIGNIKMIYILKYNNYYNIYTFMRFLR